MIIEIIREETLGPRNGNQVIVSANEGKRRPTGMRQFPICQPSGG
jgi:hypothetical protein